MPSKYFTSKLVKFLAVIAICLLFVFLNPAGIFNSLRNVFFTLSYPFQKTFYIGSRKVNETINFFGSIAELREENIKLLKENNYLVAQIAELKNEKKENALLREQLSVIPRKEYELEACLVIGQDPQKSGSWLMIDKGQNKGIEVGMPVIVSDGILVGKISEVYESASRVVLLTDSGSLVNALDLETSSKGVVKGEYGLGLLMDMVAQTDALNEGDTIVTSGLDGSMPKGLHIGKIQEVKISTDRLFQQALVIPQVKYSKLDVVFIIK